MTIRLRSKYLACGDDGQMYQIKEFQEFIDASTKDSDDVIPGPIYCTLGDGTRINRLDERTWQTVDGMVLKRHR